MKHNYYPYDSAYDEDHDGRLDYDEDYKRRDFEDWINGEGVYEGDSHKAERRSDSLFYDDSDADDDLFDDEGSDDDF